VSVSRSSHFLGGEANEFARALPTAAINVNLSNGAIHGKERAPMTESHTRRQLALSGAALVIFAIVAASWNWFPAIANLDRSISRTLHNHAKESPATVEFFRGVTWLGTHRVLIVLSLAVIVILWLKGQWRLAAAWAIVQLISIVLIEHTKVAFGRARPEFNGILTREDSLSFPSGHALGSIVAFGMLAYFFSIGWPNATYRRLGIVLCVLLILLIGFSRMYLGVHFFTDVVAGYALGGAWLALAIALIEDLRVQIGKAGQYSGTGASTNTGS
jgi:undecaprenyl-diphosphatase